MGAIREELYLADKFSGTFRNFDAAANASIDTAREFQSALEDFASGYVDGVTEGFARARAELEQMVSETEDAATAQADLASEANDTGRAVKDAESAQAGFTAEAERSQGAMGSLLGTIGKIAGAIGAVKLAKNFIETADEMSQITAKLNLINDGFMTTEQLQSAIYNSAQRTRSSYQDTAQLVARIGMNTGDTFKSNAEIVKFAENLNKSFKVAGASAQEQSSVILQLSQALAGGLLRGQEFNAVMSGAPNIIKNIANYMGVTVGQMRDLAAEGQITSDIIREAMLGATDDINGQFETLPQTFSDVMTTAKNKIVTSMSDTFDEWIDAINEEELQNKIDSVSDAFSDLAVVGGEALVGIAENWESIITAVEFAAGAIVSFKVLNLAVAAEVGTAWEGALAPLYKIAGILGALGVLVTKTAEAEERYDKGEGIDPRAKEFFEQDGNGLYKAAYLYGDALLPEGSGDWYMDWLYERHGVAQKQGVKDEINKLKAAEKAAWYAEYYTPKDHVNVFEEAARVANKAAWYKDTYGISEAEKAAQDQSLLAQMWRDEMYVNGRENQLRAEASEAIKDQLKDGVKVKGEVKLADEDLKMFRDIAEGRYMTNVNLETLAPNVSVTVEGGAGLTAAEIAEKVAEVIVEQTAERTAIAH